MPKALNKNGSKITKQLQLSKIITFDSYGEKLSDSEECFIENIAFYRKFPHLFVEKYMGLKLKEFQILLLYEMFRKSDSMLICSRGLSKTFITALFVIVYCILYPYTKAVIVSSTLIQSAIVLSKMKEIHSLSLYPEWWDAEIKDFTENLNTPKEHVKFFSESTIKLVTASESARGNRSNLTVIDEAILVDEYIYQSVLQPMLRSERFAGYQSDKRFEHIVTSKNKTVFLTSAKHSSSWIYGLYKSEYKEMAKNPIESPYFVCCLPYQVAIMSGLLTLEQLKKELSVGNIDLEVFLSEMYTMWIDSEKNGYFSLEALKECRTLYNPYYTNDVLTQIDSNDFKIPERSKDEIRILTIDVALMGSSSKIKNDNTVISFMVGKINKSREFMTREVRYMETIQGGAKIGVISQRIRELHKEFDIQYIVLDTNGVGMTIYGDLCRSMITEDGIVYKPMGCINDEAMHALCPDVDAEKTVYSVKASAEFNKAMNIDLKTTILRKRLKLLVDEKTGEDVFSTNKNFPIWLDDPNLILWKKILNQYKESTRLINELVGLEIVDEEKVKLKEKSSKVKDRYSSVAMGNHFLSLQETQLLKNTSFTWSSYKAMATSSGYKRFGSTY